jgi:solute carrier family 35 protein E1
MLICKFPYLLCTCQFLTATAMTNALLWIQDSPRKAIVPAAYNVVVYISLSYTLGFIFTNVAISIVTPSFVETIKAAEPLSSVLLGYFYFNEGTSIMTYLTLVPICSGVALSCIDNISFSIWGLVSAAVSNLGFSSRSVLTKCLNKQYPSMIDEISLFATISQLGLVLLVPLTLFAELPGITEFVRHCDLAKMTELVSLLCFNGCAYSIYNLISFVVLSRTDLVTHAVLNVFRRVVIITFTTIYFGVELKLVNICGVATAVLGVFAFGYAKNKEGRELVYLSALPMVMSPSSNKSTE